MRAQKESVGLAKPTGSNQYVDRVILKPEAPASLEEAGIDKNLAHRARKAAALSADEFEGKVSDWREQSASENRVTLDINKSTIGALTSLVMGHLHYLRCNLEFSTGAEK
jgi:hypothetical protein